MPTDDERAIVDALSRVILHAKIVLPLHGKELLEVTACDVVEGELLIRLENGRIFAITAEEM